MADNGALSVSSIDWEQWTPKERAVLCFVIKDGQVLLIEKKRGLGAGKVNGPGGRIEPGETPLEAAVRETEEEVGIRPLELIKAGELYFAFTDGLTIHCTVFTGKLFQGELVETDEARPFWQPLGEMPYDLMWADDRFWFPEMIAGRVFNGYFTFDGDSMLDHALRIESAERHD